MSFNAKTRGNAMKAYQISFPRQPIDAVIRRVKMAGFKYHRPFDPLGMGHTGSGGWWTGISTPAGIAALNLPSGTTVS
jgi:hypothetical protein